MPYLLSTGGADPGPPCAHRASLSAAPDSRLGAMTTLAPHRIRPSPDTTASINRSAVCESPFRTEPKTNRSVPSCSPACRVYLVEPEDRTRYDIIPASRSGAASRRAGVRIALAVRVFHVRPFMYDDDK